MIEQLLVSTNKMILISRCFVPVDTVARLVVLVPDKAEYETGFQTWVERVGNLASQLASKVIFITYPATASFIRNVIEDEHFSIRHEYREINSWDDFILQSAEISDEDLLMVVAARKGSISHTSDLENLPGFLGRNFARYNLLVIYPEQFGG